MTIKQLQALFSRLQHEAGERGAVIEARLGDDLDGIICAITLLDRPDSYTSLFLMDGLDDEYYVEMLISRIQIMTDQVAA